MSVTGINHFKLMVIFVPYCALCFLSHSELSRFRRSASSVHARYVRLSVDRHLTSYTHTHVLYDLS